jgi:hypothetical protein
MKNLRQAVIAVLLLGIAAIPVLAQQQDEDAPLSLGEVARQNREKQKKAEPEHVLSDEAKEPQDPPEAEETSLCGEPLPLMQQTYASAFVGQQPPSDEELGKALLEWLGQHPGLESISPEDLARTEEPRTMKQFWADHDLADKIALMFVEEMKEFREKHSEAEVSERIAKMLSAKSPLRQGDVLERAVRDEKQRRASAQGKTPAESDLLAEAINLYSICENKRLIGSQDEVEKQSKLALRTKLEQAGFKLPDLPNDTATPAKTDGE